MRAAVLVAVFVVCSTLWISASIIASHGDWMLPGYPGDTQDFDGIALNLLRGRGFAIDYTDPEFRRPYEQHNQRGLFSAIVQRHTPLQLSTYRPPLLPVAIA